MKKIGLIYWPKGGNVESVSNKIFERLDKSYSDIYDLNSINITDLVHYDCLIIGSSTAGAETWRDAEPTNLWNNLFNDLDKINLEGKKVALFGLGDQVLWPRNFVDNMIVFKREFEKRGAKICGEWPTEGYDFEESKAVVGDKFVGLAIDEDHQYDLTDKRIDKWLKQIRQEFGI